MKVVVTGSSGRVGQAIVARLLRRHDVLGFDRVPASVTQVVAGLDDEAALAKALRGAAAVVHVAALHAPHVPHVPEGAFVAANVEGTRAVARACVAAGVRTLVFTSTTALYGMAATPGDRAGWVTEETVPAPKTIYHRSKLQAEQLLQEAAASTNLRVSVLRMSRCFPEPAPAMAAYRLHRGIDVRDVAEAHELAFLSSGAPYRCYVVSGATPFLEEDASALKSDAPAVLARRAPELVAEFGRRGWPLPSTIDRVYVAARAQRDLGWSARHGFDEVLRQFDEGSPEVLPPAAG